jgi:hypothetical protein
MRVDGWRSKFQSNPCLKGNSFRGRFIYGKHPKQEFAGR